MRTNKLKLAFVTFFALAAVGLTSGIGYLQSESFANSIKKMISERSPQKLGVVGDFSNLKLYFFPPGIGVASPKIKIFKENISRIPMEGSVEAKELRLSFAPIQMFSGVIQVSEVEVEGGAIQGTLYADDLKNRVKRPKEASKLSWQDLFRVQINGFRLADTYLNIKTVLPGADSPSLNTELVVKELYLNKARLQGRSGFTSRAIVNAVRVIQPSTWKPLPIHEANQLEWNVEWTDQGLKLNPFTADLSGIRVRIQGSIDGNLLDENSDPNLRAQTELSSDLGTFFLANLNDEHWEGELEGKATVEAKLKHIGETLKAQFSFTGHEFEWKNVKADQFKSEGSIDLHERKLTLKSLEFSDRPKEGRIGRVKISAVDLPLGLNETFQAQAEFSGADIRWLGGVVAAQVAPLEGEISGKASAQFSREKTQSWRLRIQNDLKVDGFALTNQKLDTPRSKHDILRPALPVKVVGNFEVNPRGLDFHEFKLSMNRTQLQITGGVHGDGFNLTGKGFGDLKEIKEIAQNPILGEGEIEIFAHGPASALLLDFDAKLKDTSYLGMDFGNIAGHLTFSEAISELRFKNIQAHHQNTYYTLSEGFINLAGGDDLHLPFEVHVGRVEDIAEILHTLMKKVSWFPKALRGEVHGKIDVGGKLSTPLLKIAASLDGSDWVLWGERARRMRFDFGYDRGVYAAKNVVISKTVGNILGQIQFASASEEMKWDFHTENLSLLDLDFIDRLEIPAKAKISVQSSGEGKLDRLKSKSELKLFGTEIKGEQFENSSINIETGESTLRAAGNVFGDRLSTQLKYALIAKQPSFFRLDLNHFDFSSALLVLNPKLLDDLELAGIVSGHVQLDFLSTQAEFARGEVQFREYSLEKTGFRLKLVDPVSVPVQLGYFHFPPTRLRFQNGDLTMAGEGRKGDIDFHLKGSSDLAIAEFFSSSLQKVSGRADTDIEVKGPLKNLQVNGNVSFTGGRALMSWMQSPFEEIDGSLRLRQGQLMIENFEAYLGDEVFSLGGKVQTFTDRFPEIDLRAQFEDNKIKMAPLDLIQVRGVATIKGLAPPYVIGGNLEVPQALWARSFSSGKTAVTTRGDRFLPEAQDKQKATGALILDLNINAPQNFFVKNDLLDGEFRGRVKLVGPPESPRLLGEGQLVQGRVSFKDRPFILENVKITFDDPYQMNPKFNASAISEVNQYKIRVLAYGQASQWKAEFSSTPFLPESEIFSLLTSGYTTADANRYKTRDRSYVSQGEAASLILHSMDFSKDVQNKTGFQFDVEEAVDNNSANSIFRPQNLSDNIASPKLVIKRRVGRNISVSFGSTVGVGSENQKEVNAEYKLTPGMSALGVWNNIEEVNNKDTRTSFGLDLKFNHRFK